MSVAVRRLPLLGLGAAALVTGLLAGLSRAGWDSPALSLAHLHGPLMVSAFFGTVIGLERAVAARKAWAFAAPLACGLGGVALLAGLSAAGAGLLSLGSLVLLAVMVAAAWGRWTIHLAILTAGALAWCGGNLAWLAGFEVPRVVAPWAAFLILTIFGERLELTRFAPPSPGKVPLAASAAAAVLAAAALAVAVPALGWPAFGVTLLAAALWLARFDIARRTLRQPQLGGYVAACLLSGYAWLAAAGLWAALVGEPAGFAYDGILHGLFVGFVFAMIFGHAPIILPSILGIRLPFTRLGYAALAGLHGSVALRLVGDLMESADLRAWGAAANVAVLAAWVAMNVITALAAGRRPVGGCAERG